MQDRKARGECNLLFPVDKEVSKTPSQNRDEILMQRICKQGSPMCDDWDMYNQAKEIFEARGVPFSIALGIMNAESTIGKHYARGCNASYNNWGGIKWKKLDDGTNVKDQKIPDENGCWVYKFESLEAYFISKANTLGIGYETCFEREKPITCIAYSYVGNPNVAEPSWIRNVSVIAE